MKAILRSFVVISTVLAFAGMGSSAYFTANAVASNNQITTGTMVLYVGSHSTPTGNRSGQWVVYADKNNSHQVGNFEPITNVEPGVTKSTYMVVANYGSLDFQYKVSTTGAWQTAGLDSSLMATTNYHRFAADNCEADAYCEDIYYWLVDNHYTNVSAGANDLSPATLASATGDAARQLSPMQFTVYRMDWQLSPSATNAYQGETYLYNVLVDGKQVTATSF